MDLEQIVNSVLDHIGDSDFDFQIFPAEYLGRIDTKDEFVAVSILLPSSDISQYGPGADLDGLLIFSVFVQRGHDSGRMAQIMEQIRSRFLYKRIGIIDTRSFSIGSSGPDSANKMLDRADLRIEYKAYGV